jgi:hypothetical protein
MRPMPDFEELARHRGVPEVLAVVAAALVVVIARVYFWHLGLREGATIAVCVVGSALLFSAIGSWRAERWSRLELAVAGAGGALLAASLLVATLTHSFRGLLLGALTAWLIVAPREEPEEEEVTPEEAAEEMRLQTEQERRRLVLDRIRACAGRL